MNECALRPASAADCRFVHAIHDQPSVRARSISQEQIPYADHETWYAARLDDPCYAIFVAENAGEAVGVVRLAEGRDETEISIALDADATGKGLGRVLIRLAVEAAQGRRSPVSAYIRPDNLPSRRAFEGAGFVVESECRRNGVDLLRYLVR
ncbi:MAG: GNAT family N-acetyltransferase [Myxococcota bacterium]